MSKKKKENQVEVSQEIVNEPVFEVITEPKKQKTRIDFSQWSYKDLLSYCEKNKISTMWKNPQQIRAMLQKGANNV